MPSLDEIRQKRQKKFVKKPYRVWNLDGENIANPLSHNNKSSPTLPSTVEDSSTKKNRTISQQKDNEKTTIRQQLDNKQALLGQQNKTQNLSARKKSIVPFTPKTIRQQIDNKSETNRQQSNNKKETIRQQQNNRSATIEQQLDNTLGNDWATEKTTIRQQIKATETIEIMPDNEVIKSIRNLSGLQEKLFYIILEYCNLNNDLYTGRLNTARLAYLLGCAYSSAKIIIERITKKSIIKRLKGKTSVAGFIQFEMSKETKLIGNNLLLQRKNIDPDFKKFLIEIRQQLRQQLDNTLDNTDDSSSSVYINTTTTGENRNGLDQDFPQDWQLDIEPLQQIGFTKTHLKQIVSQDKLSPQVVQDSIYAFAFDLENNDKAKKINSDPINYFMGILRNGKVYTFPSNYESPQEKAMRIHLERTRELERKKAEMEKEAINLAFSEWFSQLTDDQKKECLPEMMRRKPRLENSKLLESSAWNKFEKEIWPSKRAEIIGFGKEGSSNSSFVEIEAEEVMGEKKE